MKKFGFGLMRLPTVGDDRSKIDMPRFEEMVDAFLAAGGTYFDTAYPYHGGFSEVAFREAVVKRYPRDAYTVTDKLPIFRIKENADMQPIFDEQLERCGVEYFDYYWIHALSASRLELAEQVGAFQFLADKKAEGKIRHIGFSFHDTPEVLEKILTDHPEMEYVQLQLNYMDWEEPSVQARGCYEVATAHGKPVIVMEPVKGGTLAALPPEARQLLEQQDATKSMASWAIRYAASLDNVMMVLSGMSNMEQMEDNLSYMKDFRPLNNAEQEAIENVTRLIRSRIAVACTGCRYCVSENTCPRDILIPDLFEMYNLMKMYDKAPNQGYYQHLTAEHGKASDCIACGMCEEHCPQHLPIRAHLQSIAQIME